MARSKSSGSALACLVFSGILIFMFVYFPLRGGNLPFEVGVLFRHLYFSIGMYILYFGVICILFGILAFFSHHPMSGFVFLIIGVILLAAAGYLFSPAGASGNGGAVPKGYH